VSKLRTTRDLHEGSALRRLLAEARERHKRRARGEQVTSDDWKNQRAQIKREKMARLALTDIEADALLVAIDASQTAGAVLSMSPDKRSALFRATAKIKLARAAVTPSQAEVERDRKKP
jgi:hypothetical protein